MNIALTFDKNRLEEACVLIQSINDHCDDWNLFLYYADSDFLQTCYNEVRCLKPDVLACFIQPELRVLLSSDSPNIDTPFGLSSFIRLGLSMFHGAQHLDKVLYLDTDIIIYNDLQELYDSDISNVDVLGFPEYIFNSNYMNSGALLLNLDRLRRNDHAYSALMSFNMHQHRNPDQDCINLHYDKSFFDPKFGKTLPLSLDSKNTNPVLRHFSCWKKLIEGPDQYRVLKPWETEEHEHHKEWIELHDRNLRIRNDMREHLLTNR